MKKFTPRIHKALNLACELHDGQKRKGDELPYIVHPFSVALILMDYTDDEDVLIAGILHDTVEDTDYSKEQLERDFGSRVAEFVLGVTELEGGMPWKLRKDDYLRRLSESGYESKLICVADKIHNLQAMTEAFRKFGEKAEKSFNAPADKKLWFYGKCLDICRNEPGMPSQIISDFEEALLGFEKQMAEMAE